MQVGASTYVFNAAFPGSQVRQIPNAQNNSISYDIALPAGTYKLEMIHYSNNNIGIYTITIDGASLTSMGGSADTIDGYAAAGAAALTAITGIVIPTLAVRRWAFTMATKNGLSSAFFGQIHALIFTKTA